MNKDEELVSGCIQQVFFPKTLEAFVDYAIFEINGCKIKGRIPFLDYNFTYHLWCRRIIEKKSRLPILIIERLGKPGYEPLPLTIPRLKSMLINIGHSPLEAEAICLDLQCRPSLAHINFDKIQPETLLMSMLPAPAWLEQLTKSSLLFRYPFIEKLVRLWPLNELKRLSVFRLSELTLALANNPESFAYSFKNSFDLPELTWKQLHDYTFVNYIPLDDNACTRIQLYVNMQMVARKERRLAVSPKRINEWKVGSPQLCVSEKILRPLYVKSCKTGKSRLRWIAENYVDHCRVIGEVLHHLFSLPTDGVPLRSKPPANLDRLNQRQREVYDLAQNQNFFLVLGDAGTGKTLLASYLFRTFEKGTVLPLAYYGRVAAGLRRSCGVGMTVHKLMEQLRRRTAKSEKIRKQTKVVFFDEGSVLTLLLVRWVLEALPNVEKVFIFGDPQQMSPPTAGPIFPSLVQYYEPTSIVQRLYEIMRIDDFPEASTMRDNARGIARGTLPLYFANTITDDGCPWIILPRKDVLPHQIFNAQHSEIRIAAMVESLRPLITFFSNDKSKYQLMTQKNSVCRELNAALQLLFIEAGESTELKKPNCYKKGSKVVFTVSTYGNEPILPKDSVKRAETQASSLFFLRTCAVMNGEMDIVEEVFDCEPLTGTKVTCSSTNSEKVNPGWQRIIRFKSGRQINLTFYPLGNVAGGDAATVASLQGSEMPAAVYWLHQGFTKRLFREEFYTAVTRGRRWVIIFCNDRTDLQKVLDNVSPPRDNVLAHWLPN